MVSSILEERKKRVIDLCFSNAANQWISIRPAGQYLRLISQGRTEIQIILRMGAVGEWEYPIFRYLQYMRLCSCEENGLSVLKHSCSMSRMSDRVVMHQTWSSFRKSEKLCFDNDCSNLYSMEVLAHSNSSMFSLAVHFLNQSIKDYWTFNIIDPHLLLSITKISLIRDDQRLVTPIPLSAIF